MGRFQVNGRGAAVLEGVFPAGNADAPFVAGLEAGETPFGTRRDEIVSIEHGKIEELLRDLDADGVLSNIFGAGAAVAIAVEASQRTAAATFQLGPEDVGRHDGKLAATSANASTSPNKDRCLRSTSAVTVVYHRTKKCDADRTSLP
jgi:hypothetical protein